MARTTILLALLVCLVNRSIQRSLPTDDSYVAAVVEFQVTSNATAAMENYLRLISEAAEQNADIVVFPEMTLTRAGYFTVPINSTLKEYPTPALNPELYDDGMVSISRAARENQIYVVVNVQERMDCADAPGEYCPEQKVYLFNTNVVFDRTGTVIDRYRKINLFGEVTRTPSLDNYLGVFDTDFGVRFGHFICFDLMFQIPAVQLVEKNRLTDVVFTTMWFSELPYLTAVQIQEAYAYRLGVNFLAAGANNVRVGSAGSGIYSGKAGALVSTMPGVPTTRLMVARVPKVPGEVTGSYPGPIYDAPTDHDSLFLITDPSFPSHVSRELTDGRQEFTITDEDVTCKFSVTLRQTEAEVRYKYRAAAFSGVRTFSGIATGGTRLCSIVACAGDTIDTCGTRFPTYLDDATSTFEELSIIATFPTPVLNTTLTAQDSEFFPISLNVAIMPLEPQDTTFTEEIQGPNTVFTYTLENHDVKLYTFSVWGRVYGWDGYDESPPVGDIDWDVQPSPGDGEPDSSSVHLLYKMLLLPTLALMRFVN
ncbi:vanin-like protein 1 [Plodia interpunctella]|uniref:vanin-like protein 1 n=1 Tax=Plodia interpunctella TaxID=58824 RepID=UPI0023678892|nr:vanin-like protein 1 [Plodia interpunctella]